MKLLTSLLTFALFTSVIAIFPNQACAKNVKAVNKPINIGIPKGFCELDMSQPFDRKLLRHFNKSRNESHKIITGIAGCGQLKSFRLGKTYIDEFGFLQKTSDDDIKKFGMSKEQLLDGIKKNQFAEEAKSLEEIDKEISFIIQNKENIPNKESDPYLVAVNDDNSSLYFLMYMNIGYRTRHSSDKVAMLAISFINNQPYTFMYFKNYRNKFTLDALKEYVSNWVSLTKSKNK